MRDKADLDLFLSVTHIDHRIIMIRLCNVEFLCSFVLIAGSLVGFLRIVIMTSFTSGAVHADLVRLS